MIISLANPHDDVCVMGDFNINLIQFDTNKNVCEFLEILYLNHMFSMILRPSRISMHSCTFIGNIFFNNSQCIVSGLVICDISDYQPIFACFSCCNSSHKLLNNNTTYSIDTRYLSNTNAIKLCNKLASVDWSFISDNTDINSDYKIFLNTYLYKHYLFSKPCKPPNIKLKQP